MNLERNLTGLIGYQKSVLGLNAQIIICTNKVTQASLCKLTDSVSKIIGKICWIVHQYRGIKPTGAFSDILLGEKIKLVCDMSMEWNHLSMQQPRF